MRSGTAWMNAPNTMLRRALDWLFRNRHTGAITIGQAPNLSIMLFGIVSIANWLLSPGGTTGLVLTIAARVFLAWWAADELLRGVNPWRRMLGAAVLGYLCLVTLQGVL